MLLIEQDIWNSLTDFNIFTIFTRSHGAIKFF